MHTLYGRQLAHFLTACEHRSLRAAAEDIGLTQPALSKSIQKLEDQLGVKLFERTATGVTPTDFGETLRRHGQIIVNESRYVQTEIAARRTGVTGSLHIGAGPPWSIEYLPRVLPRFFHEFPNIQIDMQSGVTDYLIPLLHEGRFDLILGALDGIESSENIRLYPIMKSSMDLYVRPGHPLLAQPAIEAVDLTRHPWTCFTYDQKGQIGLQRFFQDRGLESPVISMQTSSFGTMLSVVRETNYLAYIADSLASDAGRRGLVRVPFDETIWSFQSGMAIRRYVDDLTPVKFLIELIDQSVRSD